MADKGAFDRDWIIDCKQRRWAEMNFLDMCEAFP